MWPSGRGRATAAYLNEVLSIRAQESDGTELRDIVAPHLNEVLSIRAQEFPLLRFLERRMLTSMKS